MLGLQRLALHQLPIVCVNWTVTIAVISSFPCNCLFAQLEVLRECRPPPNVRMQ